MLKINTDSVKGYKEIGVPFTLISKEENSKNLAIFLPGAGYTVQSPLFHYSKDIFINKSFDVLQVKYQYNEKAYEEFSKKN